MTKYFNLVCARAGCIDIFVVIGAGTAYTNLRDDCDYCWFIKLNSLNTILV